MIRFVTLLWALFRHRKTPFSAKALLGAGVLYGASPIDLIPDIIPLLGQEDDLVILLLVFAYFWWQSTQARKEIQAKDPQTDPAK